MNSRGYLIASLHMLELTSADQLYVHSTSGLWLFCNIILSVLQCIGLQILMSSKKWEQMT